ncbi:MAG: helix-turn-helix transcriptional regulator [Chloroflexi bacterium]|nr:helix-turn-helix transcriptional regulator [Chloroflexota bacterium]
MRELMERRGLTVAELAERSGYTVEHIRRVIRGDHPGSKRFQIQMETLLGGKFRVGEQLTWDKKLLPQGVWGNNDLASIAKAQGITKPQGFPPLNLPRLTKEEREAFGRAMDEFERMEHEMLAREQTEPEKI